MSKKVSEMKKFKQDFKKKEEEKFKSKRQF